MFRSLTGPSSRTGNTVGKSGDRETVMVFVMC